MTTVAAGDVVQRADAVGIRTRFTAMASPCEIIVDTNDSELGAQVGGLARAETLRIETKYTRYQDSVITRINRNAGQAIEVDSETADLLDFAVHCYEISQGRFDITSGALRKVWQFNASDKVPAARDIKNVMRFIGWKKVKWKRPHLTLRTGMEIDFGGIGKEYAVDRALTLAMRVGEAPILVNLGGDLRASQPRTDGSSWRVAIESVDRPDSSEGTIELPQGALATSGDTHRFVLREGKRYGHLLDPRTGWPIEDAPRSVTVAAATCTEAGLLAKLAMLQGRRAERFLKDEGVRAWCIR